MTYDWIIPFPNTQTTPAQIEQCMKELKLLTNHEFTWSTQSSKFLGQDITIAALHFLSVNEASAFGTDNLAAQIYDRYVGEHRTVLLPTEVA